MRGRRNGQQIVRALIAVGLVLIAIQARAYVTLADRLIATKVASSSPAGYFVINKVAGMRNANFGGKAAADALCLTDLNSGNWMGKASAGTLTSARVKSFLCDSLTGCNSLTPNTKYYFAAAGEPTTGGASFTTDGSGAGPGDANAWDGVTYFNVSGFGYWTGRAAGGSGTVWPSTVSTTHCIDWTNGTGGQSGTIGFPGNTNAARWMSSTGMGCNATNRFMICIVNPP